MRNDVAVPLFDGQGSERTVTNSSQTVTGTLTTSAFGQTVATTGSSASPYMYAATSGYRNEGDAGLMKVGARYYDAQTGTFTSRDTYLDQKPYLYCEHNPVNAVDPSGHITINFSFSFGFGSVGISISDNGAFPWVGLGPSVPGPGFGMTSSDPSPGKGGWEFDFGPVFVGTDSDGNRYGGMGWGGGFTYYYTFPDPWAGRKQTNPADPGPWNGQYPGSVGKTTSGPVYN